MSVKILIGDALAQLRTLPDESVQCCVTSPPYYGLRDYGVADAIGLEPTPEAHIAALVEVFREVRRVLRKDGVLWLNYGDAYTTRMFSHDSLRTVGVTNGEWCKEGQRGEFRTIPPPSSFDGLKPKDLLMMPSRVALALQADGWWLRSMLPWVKRSAMPESVTDRPATAIEYVFLLTRSPRYFFDMEAVRQREVMRPQNRLTPRDANAEAKFHGQPAHRRPEGGTGNGSRNFRNSDLFYASLEPPHGLISGEDGAPLALDVNPAGFAEAHFATFPPKLIEPLIKAATSEKGCCPACGAPWVREVETDYRNDTTKDGRPAQGNHRHDGTSGQRVMASGVRTRRIDKTLGWSPSCACGGEPVPCSVLDPFGGAGTTGLVADRLGRDAVLIELNPEYAAMARKRIAGDAPLFAEVLRQAQDEGRR